MSPEVCIDIRFTVPRASRVALAGELARGSSERTSLAAMYLDTDDQSLARVDIEWCLRRDGRRWVQTLRCADRDNEGRVEHEVIRPRAEFDAAAHAGTLAGERLLSALGHGAPKQVAVRFQTEIRRTSRRIRTRGSVVDVTLDDGRLISDQATQRIVDVEFRLVSGSVDDLLRLIERWRKRHGLLCEPRSQLERGERLADGALTTLVRKGARPTYDRDATMLEGFGSVLDECLAHIMRNAAGLLEGDAEGRAEYVHQIRVGIRRLRSAIRTFGGWTPSPPTALVDEMRALFAALGLSRDADVLDSGVAAALQAIGAPPVVAPTGKDRGDPIAALQSDRTQSMFLAWLGWRLTPVQQETPGSDAPVPDERSFRRRAQSRLRRWHRRIAAQWKMFATLDESGLHDLRKRIKRQRYAVEFLAPLMARKRVNRYLLPLATIQERMGELNDLFVARTHYQGLVAQDPAAWFALGWIAARIELIRSLAEPELARLVAADPPRH